MLQEGHRVTASHAASHPSLVESSVAKVLIVWLRMSDPASSPDMQSQRTSALGSTLSCCPARGRSLATA